MHRAARRRREQARADAEWLTRRRAAWKRRLDEEAAARARAVSLRAAGDAEGADDLLRRADAYAAETERHFGKGTPPS